MNSLSKFLPQRSCVTYQYIKRVRNVAEVQYVSIKSSLERTLNLQGWTVSQRIFISGTRSLNEKDLHDNLAYFKVTKSDMESIRSKLVFKIFDEYANILTSLQTWQSNNIRRQKEKEKKGVGLASTHIITYI